MIVKYIKEDENFNEIIVERKETIINKEVVKSLQTKESDFVNVTIENKKDLRNFLSECKKYIKLWQVKELLAYLKKGYCKQIDLGYMYNDNFISTEI